MSQVALETYSRMSPVARQACLTHLRDRAAELDDVQKEMLMALSMTEQDDILGAMMVEILAAHVDEAPVRETFQRLEARMGHTSPGGRMLQAVYITASYDDQLPVREWGRRRLLERERVDPAQIHQWVGYLTRMLEDRQLSPYVRWHAALALAHAGGRGAVESLLSFGHRLEGRMAGRPAPDAPHLDAGGDAGMDGVLAEKLIHALGMAADAVAREGKRTECVDLMSRLGRLLGDEAQGGALAWSMARVENTRPLRIAAPPPSPPSLPSSFIQWLGRLLPTLSPAFSRGAAVAAGCVLLLVGAAYMFRGGPSPHPLSGFRLQIVQVADPSQAGMRGPAPRTSPERVLEDADSLRSGDYFKIQVRLPQPAWLYLLLHDSSGEVLFSPLGRLSGGRVHRLPEGAGYPLDGVPGAETVYLLAAIHPIPDFDRRAEAIGGGDMKRIETLFPEAAVQSIRFRHE